TAADMAADIRSFLEFRPVVARPVGTATRLMRCVRRNPASSISLALAAILVLGGPLTILVLQYSFVRELAQEQMKLQQQKDENQVLYLSSKSEELREENPAQSLLLAMEAMRRAGSGPGPAYSAAYRAMYRGWLDTHRPWRELTLLSDHQGAVYEAAFSADEKRLATWSQDKTVIVWDTQSWKPICRLKHGGPVVGAAFDRAGERLATASMDGTVRIWTLPEGRAAVVGLRGFQGSVRHALAGGALSVDPRGETFLVSGGFDYAAYVYDFAGNLVGRLPHSDDLSAAHGDTLLSVSFGSRRGTALTGSRDGTARSWDAETGALKGQLGGRLGAGCLFVRIASDRVKGVERAVAFSYSEDVSLWESSSEGWRRLPFAGLESVPYCASYSEDGRVVAVGYENGRIVVHDHWTGESRALRGPYRSAVTSIAMNPGGDQLAAGNQAHAVLLFDLTRNEEVAELHGHEGEITSVTYSPSGRLLVSTAGDGTARVWDATGNAEYPFLVRAETGGSQATVFNPIREHELCVELAGGEIEVLNTASASSPAILGSAGGPGDPRGFSEYSRDGRTILLHRDATGAESFLLYDARLARKIGEWRGRTGALSNDGKMLAISGTDSALRILSIDDPSRARMVSPLQGLHRDIAFTAEDRAVVSRSEAGTLYVWKLGASEETWGEFEVAAKGRAHRKTFISKSRTRVAAVSHDQTVRLYDLPSGVEAASLTGHRAKIELVTFAPDDRFVVTVAQDKTVRVWNAETGRLRHILRGHTGQIMSVTVSPDASLIATASEDGTAALWDSRDGSLLAQLTGHEGRVKSVSFNATGSWLATASDDGTIRLWPVHPMRAGCLHSPRALLSAELERFQLLDDQEVTRLRESRALQQEALRRIRTGTTDGWLIQDVLEAAASDSAIDSELLAAIRDQAWLEWDDAYELANRALAIVKNRGADHSSYEVAERSACSAVRIFADNWDHLLTLGITEYRLGNLEESLRRLDASRTRLLRQSVSDSPTIHLFRAMAWARLENQAAAMAEYQLARRIAGQRKTGESWDLEHFLEEAEELLGLGASPR
ncbi:MAG: WD40 repeat domain-containing protein, partial [Planctomycetota bacterium]